MPEISVIMSVYNGERYLAEAINSILDQSNKDFEFIIIDDGSEDDSSRIVKTYNDSRIVFAQQSNKGLAAALNMGLKIARGKYVARMDADDISLPMRLDTQYRFLEEHRECVCVGSNAMLTDLNGTYLCTSNMPVEWEDILGMLPQTPFYHSSTFFRKEAAVSVGGYFAPVKQYGEDVIFFNKLARLGELRNIGRPLIEYRLVPSASTSRSSKNSQRILEVATNILNNGSITEKELATLKRATKKKSSRWEESYYYLHLGKLFLEKTSDRRSAFRNLCMSIRKQPLNSYAWFNAALLLCSRRLITKWKKIRTAR